MEKINKRIKILNPTESESVLDYFKNKNNIIYKNNTESSLKQMMKILNENELINGERKLGKDVPVELYHSSLITRLKAGMVLLSSYILTQKEITSYEKYDANIKIRIYEDNAFNGILKNLKNLFKKFVKPDLLNKEDYLNYVLSHEYGHLKHSEWQAKNKLFCPLKDRESLFMNLITNPETLNNSLIPDPNFINEKIIPLSILEVEPSSRRDRNNLTFQETFADIYALISLKQAYDKETYEDFKRIILKERLMGNRFGSDYYTSDAIKEFIDNEPNNLDTQEKIIDYVMDISTKNGFKYFINKYNNELNYWTNIVNKFGEVKGIYKEYEKNLFCEIAFIVGGLIPNAINNDLVVNMKILQNEFGINFGFISDEKYMEKMQEIYNSEINLYMLAGDNKNNILLNKTNTYVSLVNNYLDKDLVKYINEEIVKLEKCEKFLDRDLSIHSMFNYRLNNIYYIAGFLAQKEVIKHNINTKDKNKDYSMSESYKELLTNIGIKFNQMENLEKERRYRNFRCFDNSALNEDMFFAGKNEAQKRMNKLRNNLSMSSVIKKLKNKSEEVEQNMLIHKKGINCN